MKKKSPNKSVSAVPVCAMAATRKAARLLTQLYDSHLAEHGLEGAQFALLMTIEASPDKGQTAIARAMGMDKTTLSRNLKVLRQRGWVATDAGQDARSRLLGLTQEGKQLLTEATPSWERAQKSLLDSLKGGGWTAMIATQRGLANAAEMAMQRS